MMVPRRAAAVSLALLVVDLFPACSFAPVLLTPTTRWQVENASKMHLFRLQSSQKNDLDPVSKKVFRKDDTSLPVATTGQLDSALDDANDEDGVTVAAQKVPFPIVLWRFTRPHTLIGSALAIPALHFLAAPTLAECFTSACAASIAFAMLPSLLMNLYITGLNQVTDVEIDKINKPNLPIAAGILSPRNAVITCVVSLILALTMGVAHPVLGTQGLNVALWGSMILGTMYSLEPFRLKRFPALAAFCIVAVRGTIINASFFAHAKAAAFGDPSATVLNCLVTDARCLFSSMFFCIFGIVIALMKDVPDVVGDQVSSIRTFPVRVGPQRIFHTGRRLLTGLFMACGASFVRLATTSATPQLAMCRAVTAVCAFAAGLSVRNKANAIDPENPRQVYKYYMHLWQLFYLSYLVLPFAR